MKKRQFSSEYGVSMLDAAITIPVFIIVLFFIIDAARISYLAVSLQDSLHRTARWAITGERCFPAPDGSPICFDTREEALKEKMQREASDRGITINDDEIYVCTVDVADCTCAVDDDDCPYNNFESTMEALDSGRLFKLTARTRLGVPLTLFTLDIERTALGRNESF